VGGWKFVDSTCGAVLMGCSDVLTFCARDSSGILSASVRYGAHYCTRNACSECLPQ